MLDENTINIEQAQKLIENRAGTGIIKVDRKGNPTKVLGVYPQGELDLYEKFQMTPYYRTAGSGYLQYKPDGMKFEMNDLANYMIRTSDNTATNVNVNSNPFMPIYLIDFLPIKQFTKF